MDFDWFMRHMPRFMIAAVIVSGLVSLSVVTVVIWGIVKLVNHYT